MTLLQTVKKIIILIQKFKNHSEITTHANILLKLESDAVANSAYERNILIPKLRRHSGIITYANIFFRLEGDGVVNGVYGIHAREKKLLFCTTLIVSTLHKR